MVALLSRSREGFGIGVGDAIFASVCWAVAFVFIGAFVGCFHARRLRGILWGALVGLILGLFVGPVLLIPSSELPFLLFTSMVGAAMLVAVSAMIRLTTKYGRADSQATEQANGADKAKPHPLDPDP
jgi:hypothetical protein